MLETWMRAIQVPRSCAHILWYVWVDLLSFFIHGSWGNSCLPRFLKLSVPSVILVGLEHSIRRSHLVRSI